MAVITSIATGDMRCVFAGRNDAIVAGTTSTDHLRVINTDHGLPQVGAVAIFTDGSRLYVRWTLARGLDAVMAAGTIAGDAQVIEVRRQPGGGAVAVITSIATRDMRCVFAGRNDAIVAGTTATDHLRVIDTDHGLPQVGAVAIFTDGARLNMCRTLARGLDAVMAAGTIAGDAQVIKVRR